MTFILPLLISALLFVAETAGPLGTYLSPLGTAGGVIIYIKEDNTVNVMYRCLTDRTHRAGPYRLRPGSGVNEYVIQDDSSPKSSLLDVMREDCPESVLDDGDLLSLSFTPGEDSLTTSLGNRSVTFEKVGSSFFITYVSGYLGLEIEVYVSEYVEVEVTVNCGDSEVTAILYFKPDESSDFPSQSVLYPEEIEYYDQFKDQLSTVCSVELSPNDFMTMDFINSTTAFTELGGEPLTLTAV
ncbi:hypothetical protein FOZ60_006993 [Perkinsus olseni]|uniref:Uncharacterized protein n=1 Tax=Perkinsus olseni TaxID=32597 RepID=A0A7J6NML4_PEROL|nr:hypothetical protein FOZ60_006993 [Perkinsus olseni]